jgi:glycosyltransferase domain-containing protein
MINLLDNLTLVVPTYNRQRYALRNMRYWSARGVTVHVMDGSSAPIAPSELTELALNIHYHHLPVSFHDRMKVAIGLVETKYSAMMCDDEFFIPSGLEACIRELEAHTDLVSCAGRCMGFDALNGFVSGAIVYPRLENYSILQEDPLDRMNAHMAYYVPSTIYSVVRTPVWLKAMSAAVCKVFSLHSFEELAFELAVCYCGKSKVISELSWLRSSELPPVRSTDTKHEVKVSASEWLHDLTYSIECIEFFEVISSALAQNENEISDISLKLEKAIRIFQKSNKSTLPLYLLIIYKLSPYFNRNLKNLLKPIIGNLLPGNRIEKTPILEAARGLADTDVKVNFDELLKIESIIQKFHSNEEKSF